VSQAKCPLDSSVHAGRPAGILRSEIRRWALKFISNFYVAPNPQGASELTLAIQARRSGHF
jgi:hypothetical protein